MAAKKNETTSSDTAQNAETEPKSTPFIVAAGASGAESHSLERFLATLTVDDEMAVVLVFQHREALDDGRFTAALSEHGRSLTTAVHGALVEPGRIYWSPLNTILTVEDGRFQIRDAQEPPGERGTIDSFLISVAQDREDKAIGVVFSGTNGDGTLGVTALKEAGGLTLAEESPEISAEGIVPNHSPVAIADFVLPPEELAKRVQLHVSHSARYDEAAHLEAEAVEVSGALASIATILRNNTGHDFHGYKPNTFLRRVQRRMQVVQVETIDAYVEVLRAQPEESQNLFNDLLIGVTQFFRDRREFELLEAQVIPKLFEGKTRNDQIRIWVLGCSTGEEAYSIGILLREHMAVLDAVPHVQIFASDIDGRALASARVGRYTEAIAKDMTPERLARWFVKEGNTYCVVKELREMCIFSQHSVIKDAPFSRLDMISCRNLLIYLNADLQDRVIPLFHFALRPGGYLFLGNSENISRHTRLFAPVDRGFRIFQRLETSARVLPDFPFTAVDRRPAEGGSSLLRPRRIEASLARQAEAIAERHAPAYVVTDENFDVMHFSGRTGRFIEPAGGAATLNLLNLVHNDLRLDLRAALTKAAEEHQIVQVDGLRMGTNGKRLIVDIIVEPVRDQPNGAPGFVVVFKDRPAPPEEEADTLAGGSFLRDEHVQRLETDLRVTRERLQATIEELESTNEELKSSNEEYQSLNEELQSANEELETSKEELQSVNEELTTVNGELAHRVQELGRSNSDLKNLLESTQIATIFLDNDMRVMNYTPAVTEIFHLVETDVGRPIGHIKSRITYDELQDDARRVIRSLGSVDREIEDPATGTRYMVRVLPYRSIDNYIGGAVVTFMDVTPLTRAQLALRESEERFRAMAEQAEVGIAMTDREGRAIYVNDRYCAILGLPRDQIVGRSIQELIPSDDQDRNDALIEQALSSGESSISEKRHRRPNGSITWVRNNVSARRDASGAVVGSLIVAIDLTERVRAEEALRESEQHTKLLLAELQHRVRNTLAIVRSITRRTAANSSTVDDYAMHLEGRIEAFARTQTMATRSADSVIDLEELVRDELLAHAVRDDEKAHVDGPPVRLRTAVAEKLGLAIHELATNAVKYGALAESGGHIDVTWIIEGVDGERMLRLEWRETEVHVASAAPRRRGFGTELIERTLPYEIDAKTVLEFSPGGVRCVIEFPLNQRTALLSHVQPSDGSEEDDRPNERLSPS
ncbi:CheR family methyltransferase [Microvirga lotononidis]|uniref:Blue-light-activated histidine kinase n=1 Tax=Microvirga lotononidis TaxID=864069 RepID=I4YT63_9HYPH|nr:CheR family methyltransferase [Microvirga lotononidis]EIM27155.1 PAS domain S-box [Microvirga lotononidis]WQO28660.1 CheR family methyltransferase [Microvirga lotononidis]